MLELDKKYQILIQKRFLELKKLDLAVTDKKIYRLLGPQTIQGNIAEGHSVFKGQAIPEIDMSTICKALKFPPQEIQEQRTKLCNEVTECVDALFNGTRNKLVNKKGKALFRLQFFQDYELTVDKDFFKGGVKAGRMDSAFWRAKTAARFSTTLDEKLYSIGSGAEHLVNKTILNELGLTPLSLSQGFHTSEDIKDYISKGLFVDNEQAENSNVENLFVRYTEGLGVCDDLAISTIAAINGKSAAYLGLTLDAMDTYGKWVTSSVNGGIDEFLAEHIAQKWKEKYNEELVSDEECMELIYLASKNNIKISQFSSSHRRFIQREAKNVDYTFLEHMNFIKTGIGTPNFNLGFHRTPSKQFYKNLRERFDLYGIGDLIPKGKEKIPRKEKIKLETYYKKSLPNKRNKIKSRTREKEKQTSIVKLKWHDYAIDQIRQNSSLIGLEGMVCPETEVDFFKRIKTQKETSDKKLTLMGRADLIFTTKKNITYIIEYKGRDSETARIKAGRQLNKAKIYLPKPYNGKQVLLYVSGTDYKTLELIKNNKHSDSTEWKEFQ